MQLACPHCGSRDSRISNPVGFAEMTRSFFGINQLRCRHCHTRWETSMWSGNAWKYASCPRCYRQELTTWSLQYYHPPTGTFLKIKFGATPYRCAACRCNFASFRPLRKKFAWRHRTRPEPVPNGPLLQESAALPESDLPNLAEAVGTSEQNAPMMRTHLYSEQDR